MAQGEPEQNSISMKLSIIIPVYNEKNTIREILNKVREQPMEKEIIIVDDFSEDGTRDILNEEGKKEGTNIIFQPKNMGKGCAIRAGLDHVNGDIILIQDADLEYDPNDYDKLLAPILNGEAKVVYGSRLLGGNSNRSYNRYYFGGIFLSWLTNALYGSNISDEPTCYKVFITEVLKDLNLKAKRFEFCPEVTAKILNRGYRIHEVPISYYPRHFQDGKKIKCKDGLVAIYTLIKFRLFDDS